MRTVIEAQGTMNLSFDISHIADLFLAGPQGRKAINCDSN